MFNPFTPKFFRRIALVGSIVLVIGMGVGQILKSTVDHLLYWDATAAAESWAKYVAENVTDIEDIADGRPPSAESMAFFIQTQQIRHVFGFEIINMHGDVQLASDGRGSPAFAAPCTTTRPHGPPNWEKPSSR